MRLGFLQVPSLLQSVRQDIGVLEANEYYWSGVLILLHRQMTQVSIATFQIANVDRLHRQIERTLSANINHLVSFCVYSFATDLH